jgi:hypothetical protein
VLEGDANVTGTGAQLLDRCVGHSDRECALLIDGAPT